MQQSGRVKTLVVAVLGASCGAVLGVVLLFGVALAIQTMAPLDTPPDFYVPVGIAVGVPLGAALAVYGLRRRQRQAKARSWRWTLACGSLPTRRTRPAGSRPALYRGWAGLLRSRRVEEEAFALIF